MPGASGDSRDDRITRLLEEAFALEPEERTPFLEAACPDEPEIRAEVERRLRAREELDQVGEILGDLEQELLDQPGSAGDRFRPGDQIDHFVLQETIGRGGMGIVYRARDVRLQRDVALKFLPPALARDEESKRRFLREARTASSLDHPNVGTVYEIGETPGGELFIAMAYYPGRSLQDVLEHGPLSVPMALEYATQIAEALSAAHEAGIVHRDVKPSNVLVPEHGFLKVVDFGLARWTERSGITRSGRRLGTASYMSPEQIRGKQVDERTDLWSLGVVLHEMVSGVRPFEEQYEAALLYAILNETPPSPADLRPEVPDRLGTVVERALRKDPDDRYRTADQLLADLRRIELEVETDTTRGFGLRSTVDAGERSVPPARAGNLTAPRTGLNRSRIYFGLGILLVLTLGAWYLLLSRTVSSANRSRQLRLAVLPQSEQASYRRDPVLPELAVTITDLLSRLDEQSSADLSIVPAGEVEPLATVREIRDSLAPSPDYVLTLSYRRDTDPATLIMALVDTEELDQQQTVRLALGERDAELDQTRLIAELDELLALDLSASAYHDLTWEAEVPPEARDRYRQGRQLLARAEDSGDLRTAATFLRWAVRVDSTFPEAHAALATAYWQIYERTGEEEAVRRAMRHGERARTENARRPSTHVQNGLLHVLTGSYRRALLDFKTALAQDSSLAEAYLGLGRAYEGLRRYSDAETAYEQAVNLRPDDRSGYRYLGTYYYRRGRFDRAGDAFQSAIGTDPEYGGGYVNLGAARFRQGQTEEARSAFERALSSEGLDARSRYAALSNLGTLYYYAGRYERAREAYVRALRIDSTDHRVWSALGSTRALLGASDEAVEEAFREAALRAERTLEVNPRQPVVQCQLASYRFELGQADAARRLLEKALSAAPDDPEILYLSGHLYEQLGDRDRALRFLSDAVANGLPRSQIEDDPELAPLRSDARYPAVLQSEEIEESGVVTFSP